MRWNIALFMLFLLTPSARADDSADDADQATLTQACALKGLKAGKLVVSSDGIVLFDGKRKLGQVQHENLAAFNKAKADLTCQGADIEVTWQMVFSAHYFTYKLKLAKRKLVLVSAESGDPSEEALDRAQKLLAEHKVKAAIDELADMEYPGHYVSDDFGQGVVKEAYDQAEALHKAKQDKEAAELLGVAFEYYDGNFGGGDPDKKLILYRNEWGFFLASSGQNAAAEPVLRDVVTADPTRKVAHLNLADVPWALGKQDDARKEYAAYAAAVPPAKWPAQVAQRCPACKKKP